MLTTSKTRPSPSVLLFILLLLLFYVENGVTRNVAYFEIPQHVSQKSVAIIGAGAGGTSAAYWLSENFANTSLQISSTIYEQENYVGGRCTIIKLERDGKEYIMELGASIFIDVNYNLYNSAKKFGLELEKYAAGARLGVWDGEEFVFEESSYRYWDIIKILWKYGFAPFKVKNLVDSTVKRFLQVYKFDEPFTSIQSLAERLDLVTEKQYTSYYYLTKLHKINLRYLKDLVEPASRVNYAQNMAEIHALGGMISLAPEGAKSVKGGNYQIFENWVKHSGAKLKLNTKVVKVTKLLPDGGINISEPKYSVLTEDGKSEVYDAVILAAPIHLSKIEFENINVNIKKIPYITLHVTFIAGHVNPAYFGRTKIEEVPGVVITTNSRKTDFLSFGRSHVLDNGEWVIKFFSQKKIEDEVFDRIFLDRSWSLYKIWKSYPRLLPNQTFPPIEPDSNFFYVNSFEPFISVLETEAVSSKNIVQILKRRWDVQTFVSKL